MFLTPKEKFALRIHRKGEIVGYAKLRFQPLPGCLPQKPKTYHYLLIKKGWQGLWDCLLLKTNRGPWGMDRTGKEASAKFAFMAKLAIQKSPITKEAPGNLWLTRK